MIVGIPREIKNSEYRVAITPAGVKQFKKNQHRILIERGAGEGSGISDGEYIEAGAEIVEKKDVFLTADMIYKVKELFPEEFKYLREGLVILTYLHSNAHPDETDAMLKSKAVGIAYEDIQDKDGGFPLLRPMSQIAGKGGFIAALQFSQKINQGSGLLLTRIEGVRTPDVTIIGAGASGIGAAELAAAFQNKVTVLDIDITRLEKAKQLLPANVELVFSNESNLVECLKRTDLLMNCISWPKWRTDHLVTKDMLKFMKKGALIVDVACDDAGALESCRSTTHDNPIYFEEGVMHYCVDNIPSAFSQTATTALCNATLPYAMEVADKGYHKALIENKSLRKGLSFYLGKLTLEETGKKQARRYTSPEQALEIE